MTTRKHLKRRVRLRAAQTGEPYATALRNLRRQENLMPSPAAPPGDPIAPVCAFCGKPSNAVEKLVAGPGVSICNECVQLSATVIEDARRAPSDGGARRHAGHHDRSTPDILAMLPALVRTADRIEAELAGWIDVVRRRGTDWPTIAEAAGMSGEAARRRFDPEPSGPSEA